VNRSALKRAVATSAGAVALVAAVLLGGCDGSRGTATGGRSAAASSTAASNTAQVCADVWNVFNRYTRGDAPEMKAFSKAVNDRYRGRDEPGEYASAAAAYFGAFKRDLRALADRATDPALRDALNKLADGLGTTNPSADPGAFTDLFEPIAMICPYPRSP
jgi:hypothetical protein